MLIAESTAKTEVSPQRRDAHQQCFRPIYWASKAARSLTGLATGVMEGRAGATSGARSWAIRASLRRPLLLLSFRCRSHTLAQLQPASGGVEQEESGLRNTATIQEFSSASRLFSRLSCSVSVSICSIPSACIRPLSPQR